MVATTPAQLEILGKDTTSAWNRVLIWPAGYDDNRFYPVGDASRTLLRARFGFERPTVLCLGRLARNKGYDLLVRAFAVCARRIPDAELAIAAGGESRNAGESALLAALQADIAPTQGLAGRVRMLDYVPDADLADLYRAADVFAMPSRYEPFGMTAMKKAMACGTPTVATVHGGLFRLLHFGVDSLFADHFDAEDFGITLMKPCGIPSSGTACRTRRRRHPRRALFTWSGVAQQVLNAVRSPSHFSRGLRVQEDAVIALPEPSEERESNDRQPHPSVLQRPGRHPARQPRGHRALQPRLVRAARLHPALLQHGRRAEDVLGLVREGVLVHPNYIIARGHRAGGRRHRPARAGI